MDIPGFLRSIVAPNAAAAPVFGEACRENVRESVNDRRDVIVDAYVAARGARPAKGQELRAASADVQYVCFGGPWLHVDVGVYDPKQAAFVGATTAVKVLR
jgi:hypothetical protein